jgi:tetratricopeptide (TPR) repeat protein
LPLAVHAFAGRGSELASLDALLTSWSQPGRTRAAAVIISAVSGTAGVGKTVLAVHWAHQVAGQFPDGQLYVNLRGFDPTGSAMEPAEAVRGFLEALGVPADRMPAGLPARTGLYRSLLAGKRVLVVLDNARDVEQVRPLLPGSPECLVIVTSRNQLAGLVASEGAVPLTLDLLTPAEALALLTERLGIDRVAGEPDAVRDLIDSCARLPLALAIAAARAAAHRDFPLTRLAAELHDSAGALDVLDGGDPGTDVRAVFSWSYRTLAAATARLFRLLGLHPGPDLAAPAAASLAGIPLAQARPQLAELTRAHLLTEHKPGRYAFHDLLRAYAAELAHTPGSDVERNTAVRRMLDYYLHSAHAADRLLDPSRDPIELTPAQPAVTSETFADRDEALAWLGAEHRVLLAVFNQTAGTGYDSHTLQLAWALTTFHHRRGLLQEWVATHFTALAAARRVGDRAVQADAHRDLGRAYAALDRFQDADTQLRQSLDLYGQVGEQIGRAHSYLYLARLAARQDQLAEAIEHGRRALDLFRAGGHHAGEARTLNAMGWHFAMLGEHRQAVALCEQALPLLQEADDRDSQAHTWDSLGYAHHHLGQYAEAVTCFQHALRLFQGLGDRYYQADILTHLGDTQHAAGTPDAAHDTWLRALSIFDKLGHPDGKLVRARLGRPGPARAGGGDGATGQPR